MKFHGILIFKPDFLCLHLMIPNTRTECLTRMCIRYILQTSAIPRSPLTVLKEISSKLTATSFPLESRLSWSNNTIDSLFRKPTSAKECPGVIRITAPVKAYPKHTFCCFLSRVVIAVFRHAKDAFKFVSLPKAA